MTFHVPRPSVIGFRVQPGAWHESGPRANEANVPAAMASRTLRAPGLAAAAEPCGSSMFGAGGRFQFGRLTWDFRNDLSSCAAFCRQRARDDGATTRDFPSPPWALRQQFLKGER